MEEYTIKQLECDIEFLMQDLAEIRADRGARYGSKRDTLANVREADPLEGWRAAYVNARECIHRLEKYFLKPKTEIDHTDFCNATGDLINYALYIRILYDQEN